MSPVYTPLFQRGNFFEKEFNPSLAKRGRGDLCAEGKGIYVANF
jgi:hypothetical protein